MLTATHRTALGTSTLALALGLVAACGGSGSGTSGASTSFRILTVSVPNNGIWQINRPIEFTFDQEIDFSSVNLNTINITQLNGAPAAGEFSLKSPRVVRFQPACPTRADFSDAGLQPNGVGYRINVLGSSIGGPTVRSSTGRPLTSSQVVDFTTPVSALLDPTILFIDPQLGPPGAVVRTDVSTIDASYIELGGDSSLGARRYFQPRTIPAPDLGADVPAGFKAPLNLYSDATSRVEIVLALNQPVDPSASNVNPENVLLEYEKQDGTWESLAHTVELAANCIGTGAEIRVIPTGILPQGRRVRTVLSSNFKDLVGDFNIVPIVVGTFEVDIATDPGTSTAGVEGDGFSEPFQVGGNSAGSNEDVDSVLAAPRAVWGSDGKLDASFAFDGTGGANGAFDWVIDGTFVLDTSFALITDATNSLQQTVVNGRVDIRSLWVKPTGTLIIQGVNPCRILCSGTIDPALSPPFTAGVLIQGLVKCSGTNNRGVVSFSTANIPELGAAGQAGGGDGGTGNYLTTQSTPQGGPGFGPFGAASGGGQGGETGFNPQTNTNFRKPGGGGGGRLGDTQFERTRPTCPDQRMIGLDAEKGFDGATQATGALHPGVPIGGAVGPRPFVDSDPNNDFWGTMVTATGQVIRGELPTPSAGAGGGGGGSACTTSSFPTTPFTVFGDEKGAGGGGGGGSLTILALGDIRLGGLGAASRGRIEVNGGTGGGGENTSGIDRVGGGSGGGSGGHLVLESASQIDLSRCTSVSTTINGQVQWGGLFARGGQGGEGTGGTGGARANGVETLPGVDALPPNAYPTTAPAGPCAIIDGSNDAAATVGGFVVPPQFKFTNSIGNSTPANPKICAGGDGGPGIIQLHTQNLTDIVVPASAVPPITNVNFRDICLPLPIGATPVNANTPSQWNQLLPIFGRRSIARSKWIPLGAASVPPPPSAGADDISFTFLGTTAATGVVTRNAGQVQELGAILAGNLVAAPGVPSITNDLRSVVLDASTLADDIYKRNPELLRGFVLKLTAVSTSAVSRFEVAAATYDSALDQLRLTVATSGTPLAGFAVGDAVALIPRFFRVSTEGTADSYPNSSEVKILFQTTTANSLGQPDESSLAPFTGDVSTLTSSTAKFFRFQVEFDIQADGGSLSATTPIPSLEFLNLVFRF